MSRWDGKTIGSLIGYKIFLFLIKTFGVAFSYLVLHVVAYYYFFFSTRNRDTLVEFYTTALKYIRKDALRLTRNNFYRFGQTLIDRSAFLVDKGDRFTYSFDHEDYLIDMKNEPTFIHIYLSIAGYCFQLSFQKTEIKMIREEMILSINHYYKGFTTLSPLKRVDYRIVFQNSKLFYSKR